MAASEKDCGCREQIYLALVKCRKLDIRDIKEMKVHVINYSHPLIRIKIKPCLIKKFGIFLESYVNNSKAH